MPGYRTVPLAVGSPVVLTIDGDHTAGTLLGVGLDYVSVELAGDADSVLTVTKAEVTAHADYPHTPGYLAGCIACEYACHCSDATCEHCEIAIGWPDEPAARTSSVLPLLP